ncbi:MAG: phosphate acyltransferase PlsX [Alphaproteobacteria bacterium]|nr:phosphate acyltransferase PlsX [Alphaproteobacteria bacterium]
MSFTNSKFIAIDAMGGDNAPESVIKGISRFDKNSGCHFIIFGDENKIAPYKKLIPSNVSHEFRHTDIVITSDMEVMSALRLGKKSSMGLAIQSVQSGESVAVISSGNTGLYMALAKIILKTIEGIDRPAIATLIPGRNGKSICLDLGANAESDVKNLVDFAIMGEALARSIFDKEDVKVSLMNIGSEEVKGNRLVKRTSEILKKLFDNYVGFVEGDDFNKGNVDVIVTDGFTGNIALKTMEGVAKFISCELKDTINQGFLAKLGSLIASPALLALKKKMDPRLYNGAILIGLNGIVVKSHGNSDEIGFENAVKFTLNILNRDIFNRIRDLIDKSKLHDVVESLGGEILK